MNSATAGGRLRLAPAALIEDAGWPAIFAVTAAGLTVGFFSWYAIISRGTRGPASTEALFVGALVTGTAAVLGSWRLYARYLARRSGITLSAALRYDAISWGALLLLWAGLFVSTSTNPTGRAAALAAAAWALAKLVVAARFNKTVRDVAITFLVTRVPILIIAEIAAIFIGQRPGIHYAASTNPALAVWGRWDAEHYLGIATGGYSGTEPAFFPLYPALIAVLGGITGNHLIAGLLISNAASFMGLLFFYKLVEHQFTRAVAQRATFYVSIFPTAVFFSAVYSESLFFALTVASFYYIREKRWLIAGVIGYFAAMTRVEGVLLAVPFLIEWVTMLGAGTSGIREALTRALREPLALLIRPAVGLTLVPLGLATYMTYLWVLRGDPLYFSTVQKHWNRHLAPPWESLSHAVTLIFTAHSPTLVANEVLELAFTLLMIAVLVAGIRYLRPSYWVYMLLSIVVPMSTSSLMSMPRFALVLFPMFVIFALWGARPSANNAIVAFSLSILGLYTVLFADWYWVA